MAAHRGEPASAGDRLGARDRTWRRGRRLGSDPSVPAFRPGHDGVVAAGPEHPDLRAGESADPGGAGGQLGAGGADFRVHRGDLAGRRRWGVEPVRRPGPASDPADRDAGTGGHRRVQPLSAQRHARCAGPGLHPHRASQGPDPPAGAVPARAADRVDPDGHPVRLQRGRPGDRCGVRGEDLRLARDGRVGRPGHRHPGHQHHRRDHGVLRCGGAAGRAALRRHLRHPRPRVRVT